MVPALLVARYSAPAELGSCSARNGALAFRAAPSADM